MIRGGYAALRRRNTTGRSCVRNACRAWSSPSSLSFSSSSLSFPFLRIHPEVEEALKEGRAVAALESTIVAHGLPYPQNLEVATDCEDILRAAGVVPATVAVRDGTCRIGLERSELVELAETALPGNGGHSMKVTTRDLPTFLVRSSLSEREGDGDGDGDRRPEWGATTVASTMHLAHLAGIRAFVTGGAGGVHRGVADTWDISADLTELGRTPVVVVAAGIKSVLDVPKTLEVLETLGVPVVAYRTERMPAFFGVSTERAPVTMNRPDEVAKAYWHARSLQLPSGMLLAVPPPTFGDGQDELLETTVARVLEEVDADPNITGKAVTPRVLQRVAEETGGLSLERNVALVRHNAEIGALVALELAKRDPSRKKVNGVSLSSTSKPRLQRPPTEVVVVGGALADTLVQADSALVVGTSNPGHAVVVDSPGGVGRNLAEALGRFGVAVDFYASVGDDVRGEQLVRSLHSNNDNDNSSSSPFVRPVIHIHPSLPTASYTALLDADGDLHAAIADASVHDHTPLPLSEPDEDGNDLDTAQWLLLDANPPPPVQHEVARRGWSRGLQVLWEPTAVPKALQTLDATIHGRSTVEEFWSHLTFATPNFQELVAVASVTTSLGPSSSSTWTLEEACAIWLERMGGTSSHNDDVRLIVSLGADGVAVATRDGGVQRRPPPRRVAQMPNCTGAGDTLTAAIVAGILRHQDKGTPVNTIMDGILDTAMEAAILSLECRTKAVSPDLCPELLWPRR